MKYVFGEEGEEEMKIKIDYWKIVASFEVDPQKGFTPLCPDELPVPYGDEIVDELNAQARLTHYRVVSKDSHPRNAIWVATTEFPQFTPIEGENVDIRWRLHCVPGTKGFELLDGLPPVEKYSLPIYKGVDPKMHPYGACYHDLADKQSTGAIEWLRDKKVNTVIVGGLATDYCVKKTVEQLLKAGFEVIVNLGACRGIAPDTTQVATEEMIKAGAKIVQSADDIEIECYSAN